jgi:hypothetical protein
MRLEPLLPLVLATCPRLPRAGVSSGALSAFDADPALPDKGGSLDDPGTRRAPGAAWGQYVVFTVLPRGAPQLSRMDPQGL